MATTGMLPTSNVAGNNQTSPGLSNVQGTMQPPFTPTLPVGAAPSTNPYLGATATTPAGGTQGSLYNPASSYSSGQTDISKQLVDMYGKGVGGSLNYLLQGMSGNDSAIFQQYVASMQPQMAKAQAALNTGLGAQGVGANSSVNALAQADLQSQFLAQESGVNSQLMQQQLQDTQSILTGATSDAAKEVATSGWSTFGDVMSNVTQDAGALFGGSMPGLSSISNLFSKGLGAVPSATAGAQLTGLSPELGAAPANIGYGEASLNLGGQTPDLSVFK